ncbi:general transcription factor II-I repeat domain-containing protein 2-like [Protopterus annectens]|uniref:general transcription factor II-I repeat domain-containing protein 2-like n=1 Tax=Protopterus annectens TaxID=7888 RepID=UPI001CFAD2FE|nr:general transcription factor II-I repeat domain-containing protein 2-like [Protopterus annectens]
MKNFEEISFSAHVQHIDMIIVDFENRFGDFKELEEDISIFSQPLTVTIENVRSEMELCDLQSDPFYTNRSEKEDFFKLLPIERYPKLRKFGLKMCSMLRSTYLCESSFSSMKFIKSKCRCSLTDNSLANLL